MKKLLLITFSLFAITVQAQLFHELSTNKDIISVKNRKAPGISTRSEVSDLILDSIIYEFNFQKTHSFEKFTYQYDENMTTLLLSVWDEGDVDHDQYLTKSCYSFDQYGNHDFIAIYTWNNDMKKWIANTKDLFLFTPGEIAILNYEWSTDADNWIERKKQIIRQNADGKMTSITGNMWYEPDKVYLPMETVISYTDDIATITFYVIKNMKKVPYQKREVIRKNNHSLELTSEKVYNWNGNEWQTNYDITHKYDNNDNIIETTEIKGYGTDGWIPNQQWKYSYNQYNDVEYSTKYIWAGTDWVEKLLEKWIYKYDSNGNILEIKNYYDMDADGILTDNDHYFTGTFYYSKTTDIRTPVTEASVTVYPNPATDYIQIMMPTDMEKDALIQIIDFTGKIILSTPVQSGQSVSVEALQPGVYIYQLTTKEKTVTGKLLKKK